MSHVHVSKDHFPNARKRDARQKTLIETTLQNGQSVVVDNTNPSRADRAPLIELARAHRAEVIGYYFESRVSDARERNSRREGKARVPDVAIFTTIKKLEHPAYAEGFDHLFFVRIDKDKFVVAPWLEEAL